MEYGIQNHILGTVHCSSSALLHASCFCVPFPDHARPLSVSPEPTSLRSQCITFNLSLSLSHGLNAALCLLPSYSIMFLHYFLADRLQRERSRSPRRRSRSPRRSRRSYSRSRSRSRDDYRRSDRRSRSPFSGNFGPSGYSASGYGSRSLYAPARPFDDRSVAKDQMMQAVRETSQQDRRVYVGNLSYDVKWHHLKDFMRQGEQGHIVSAVVLS